MKKICVLGSINVDLVSTTPRFPAPGETVIGGEFNTFPCGKGANQAAAAGKMGAQVFMLGMVGKDDFGAKMMTALESAGVQTVAAESVHAATGVACIQVSAEGQNTIVVCPGANAEVDKAYVDRCHPLIADCDILLLQLEIPPESVCHAIDKAFSMGKTIILDPAPAVRLPAETLRKVTMITPNESEMRILCGRDNAWRHDALEGCRTLAEMGCQTVLHKAGAKGAYLYQNNTLTRFPAYAVDVADTTAAGDAFNAALACALSRDMLLKEAIPFANAAGALATTQIGAQSAMPSWAECAEFLESARELP